MCDSKKECRNCVFLEKTFHGIKDLTTREYWIMTEVFVYLHGSDVCNFSKNVGFNAYDYIVESHHETLNHMSEAEINDIDLYKNKQDVIEYIMQFKERT